MRSPTLKAGRAGKEPGKGDANTDMGALGQRLRQLRLAKGFGVRNLARLINISPSLISHIELGRGAPSVKTLYALVAAFDVPLSEVFVKDTRLQDNDRRGPPQLEAENDGGQPPSDRIEQPSTGRASIGPVLRSGARRAIQLEHGFRWECLTPDTDPEVEFIETIIAVGGGRPDSEMKTHSGTEYGVVLTGKLGVKIAFDTHILEPRDSIRFDSTLPHCMWNAGDEPVHSIWFVRGRSV